ncbi:MAG TPA: hypothetical protein PLQ35_12475 [bacterium]|nr:hypothetical protein [bacterium]
MGTPRGERNPLPSSRVSAPESAKEPERGDLLFAQHGDEIATLRSQ